MPLPGIDSMDDLGGVLQDYTAPVDPTTDLPAAASNAAKASVVGLTYLSPRARVEFVTDGTDATVSRCLTCAGPITCTVAKASPGWWQVVFPATCTDLIGETQYWNFRWAKGAVVGPTGPYHVQCDIQSPIIVNVYMWDDTGNPDDLAGETIGVDIY